MLGILCENFKEIGEGVDDDGEEEGDVVSEEWFGCFGEVVEDGGND